MFNDLPSPYNGEESYVFVSYAHVDRDMVAPFLRILSERGYRVWYDEGIDPGTEWDANIASHIKGCDGFVAMLSKNYIGSDNCKDELNYARDLKKDRILIYLEHVELPEGMAMRLNRIQAIFKYTYTDENRFYSKLFNTPFLKRSKSANFSNPIQEKSSSEDMAEMIFQKKKDSEGIGDQNEHAVKEKSRENTMIQGDGSENNESLLSDGYSKTEHMGFSSNGRGHREALPANGPLKKRPDMPKEKDIVKKDDESVENKEKEYVKPEGKHKYESTDNKVDIKKKLLLKKILIGCGSTLLIALIIVGIVFFQKSQIRNKLAYDEETTYKVVLTAPEDMSVKNFSEDIKTIEERIKILSNGNSYGFSVSEDTITAIISKDSIGNYDFTTILQEYISRAIDLSLYNKVTGDYVEIGRQDIDNVNVKHGSIDVVGFEPVQYGITSDDYDYLEITINDEWMNEHPEIPEWGSDATIAQDMGKGHSRVFFYYMFKAEEENKYYIVDTDLNGNYCEVLKYNLMHNALSGSFSIDVSKPVVWENLEEAKNHGALQRNSSDLTGELATIHYSAYDSDELSNGNIIDAENIIKARYDAMGMPYAFGRLLDDDRTCVIKTSTSHLNSLLINLAGSLFFDASFTVGTWKFTLYSYALDDVGIFENEDGTLSLNIKISDYSNDAWNEFLSKAKTSDEEYIFFRVGDIAVFSGNIDDIADGDVQLSNFLFDEKEEFTAVNAWIVDFFNILWKGDEIPATFFPEVVDVYNDETEVSKKSVNWNLRPIFHEETLKRVVEEYAPNADIQFEYASNISTLHRASAIIWLNLDLDEEFLDNAEQLVTNICSNYDFVNSYFNDLYFILSDEIDKERSRIIFDKYYAYDGGEITSSYYVHDGRYEKYSSFFDEMFRNNAILNKYWEGKDDGKMEDIEEIETE